MRFRHWYVPALSGLFFLLAAIVVIPYPGLQEDELYFARPLFSTGSAVYEYTIGATALPVMIMSYAGALKTAVYAAIFAVWNPSVWSIRIPAVFAGVLTIWLTWVWVGRIAGKRAAAIAVVLLATDPIFLLTNTFDWGPVALQHLLLMGGLAGFDRWRRGASRWFLALAFFLWGLGLWDKALLIWPLAAMTLATVCVYPRELIRRLRLREAIVAVLALLAGAAPLVDYNISNNAQTASQNSNFSLSEIPMKVPELRVAFNGSALFGYIVAENDAPARRQPRTAMEQISVAISHANSGARRDFLIPAILVALAACVLLIRSAQRKLLLFTLITAVVIWLQMAITHNSGVGAHHVVLLWPFPFVFLALVLSGIADRFPRAGPGLIAAVAAILIAGNLRTTNEYLAEMITNGTTTIWTDAIGPLSDAIPDRYAQSVAVIDWGCASAIETLHDGRLRVNVGDIASPDSLTIRHVRERQIFPGVNDRVDEIGRRAGLDEHIERTIDDSHGRPVFEIVRFEPVYVKPPAQAAARAIASGLP